MHEYYELDIDDTNNVYCTDKYRHKQTHFVTAYLNLLLSILS